MEFYYLNHEHYLSGDVRKAFDCAIDYMGKNRSIEKMTFLVSTKSQFDFLDGLLSPQQLKAGSFNCGNYLVQVKTVRTYEPDFCFESKDPSELLMAVAVSPADLAKFEEKTDVKACFIVPWTLDEYLDFLKVRDAKDMETGEPIEEEDDIDNRVVNAINWLKALAYPNDGYNHPNDIDKLHDMANALSHYHVPLDMFSVECCARNLGLLPSSAHKTAEVFVEAQKRKLRVTHSMGLAHLKKMMEEKQ